jgi:hypothetical protein
MEESGVAMEPCSFEVGVAVEVHRGEPDITLELCALKVRLPVDVRITEGSQSIESRLLCIERREVAPGEVDVEQRCTGEVQLLEVPVLL